MNGENAATIKADRDFVPTGASRRRPKWVWIIVIFYALSAGWTVLSWASILAGVVRLNAAQQGYYASLGMIDYLSALGIGLLNLVGVVLLFRLKRSSVFVFGMSLGLNITFTVVHALTTNFLQAIGPAFAGAMLGWLIMGAVFQYTRKLTERGVLA